MISFDKTFAHEGDFSNHPSDRGGPTRFGISAKAFAGYFGFEPTAPQMATLTKSAAELIAAEYYYKAPKFDKLPNGPLAEQMFDIGFNMGPSRAWKLLQSVIGVNQDGIFGPVSWAAFDGHWNEPNGMRWINNIQPNGMRWINNKLVDARLDYYEAIIKRDPTKKVFEKGWRRRAESFRL